MPGEALLVFVILAITIVLFVSDRLRLDLVALLALLSLLITGILTPAEGLAGFSDSAVIMIAALFVVGAAMLHTGLAERVGRAIGRVAGSGRARLTAVLMLGTAVISAFVSTTGTVALMLPVTAALARNARISPSVLLLPMSVAALLGGLLTLIATAPNIIVSEQLAAAGFEPFHLFDFTPVGVTMILVGVALLVPFAGRLLPARAPVDGPAGADGVARLSGEELARGYDIGQIARVRVPSRSPLVGATPREMGMRRRYGVNVLSVRRPVGRGGSRQRMPRTTEETIAADDELELKASAEAVSRLCEAMELELIGFRSESDAVLAEVVLLPRSRLIGETLADVRFRTRYRVNVLSLRRGGRTLVGDIAAEPLHFADTLLVAGAPRRIEELRRESGDFVVVAQTAELSSKRGISLREVMTLVILLGMVVLLAFNLLPAVVAVLLAAACLVLAKCVDMETAYRSVNWQSVVLIAAMLPMATALQKTGGVDVVIGLLNPVLSAGPMALMAGIFVLTAVLGLFISNTATAVLVAPVAIGAAVELGVSPYPIMMTVAVAASTGFATPVATPVNLLVIGPGGYTFADFARVGLLVQALALVATMIVVPLLFPF
jgi:di/tricarboxylate transporter